MEIGGKKDRGTERLGDMDIGGQKDTETGGHGDRRTERQ